MRECEWKRCQRCLKITGKKPDILDSLEEARGLGNPSPYFENYYYKSMLVHFLVTITNVVSISLDGKAHVLVQTIFYIEAAVQGDEVPTGARTQCQSPLSTNAQCLFSGKRKRICYVTTSDLIIVGQVNSTSWMFTIYKIDTLFFFQF